MLLLLVMAGEFAQRQMYTFVMGHMNQETPAMNTHAAGEGADPGNETDAVDESKDIKKIALTFDDGPNQNHTEDLLDGLKERNVKATFFLLGERVERFPEIVKRIHDEGHLIGCHGYEHVDLNKLSQEDAYAQVEKTNDLIFQITGDYPEYIRPPFGSWKQDLDAQTFMIEVLWDIDTLDWSCKNVQKIESCIIGQVKDGDIILLHDAYDTTLSATFSVIDQLKTQGYEFVTVDELILE